LEIHNPELVQRVNAQIQNGHFHDADELLEKALDVIEGKEASVPLPPSAEPKNLVELFAPLRGQFTDEEVDTTFQPQSLHRPPTRFNMSAGFLLDTNVPSETLRLMPHRE